MTYIALVVTPNENTPHYEAAIRFAGAEPLIVAPADDAIVTEKLDRCAGILLAGGPDLAPEHFGQSVWNDTLEIDTERDALDIVVMRYIAENPQIPVLGICRGLQVMNALCGGTLLQDIPTQVDGAVLHGTPKDAPATRHFVQIDEQSKLAQIVGSQPWETNSYHHQGVAKLAPVYEVTAWTEDNLVEALEIPGHDFYIGVQFHPEKMLDEDERARTLFEAFGKVVR